jgi:hypothetical protein
MRPGSCVGKVWSVVLASAVGALPAGIACAAENQPPTLASPDIYSQSFKALFVLFILAVILESGLAVIFNWRPFTMLFDSRGVKTIVSIGFAYFFVSEFDLDVTTTLMNVYTGSSFPINFPGKFITALVLAGGSSGVNNLMVALGFRAVKAQEEAPKPPPHEAWISVRLLRDKAKGPVAVLVGESGKPAVAGTIAGRSSSSRLLQFFLRDQGRLPPSGGFPVELNKPYEVQLEGIDQKGAKISSEKWGPYSLAAGALVDLEITL